MTIKLRTSPVLVAAVLAHYDEQGPAATERACKIHNRTLYRWVAARAANPAWLDEQTALWATRDHAAKRRDAAQIADYRKRRYLTGRQTIPAIGTQRRIHALHALGWNIVHIAAYGDWCSPNAVSEVHKRARVTPATAAAIEAAYAALSMKLGPSDKTRRLAARKGWAVPLAWDDRAIDDPDARPHTGKPAARKPDDVDHAIVNRLLAGERIQSTRAEKFEAMRRWLHTGGSEAELCRMHRWKDSRYTPAKAAA